MDISIHYDYRADELKGLGLHDLVEMVLASENLPFNTEVSLSFVTNETIAALNERYRHADGPTDVLSFPCDSPAQDLSASLLSQDPVLELGDVIIAVDVAEESARTWKKTLDDEIYLLVVHGLLHLCEYDHVDDDDANVMAKRERELLDEWSKNSHGFADVSRQ